MKRILQTELLEEIRDDINAELKARQNIKEAEQTPTNKESAPCCKATFALLLEYGLYQLQKCPICGATV